MILYHGSNVEFDKIDLLKSKPNKDFGRGFYLSDNIEQALAIVFNSDTYQKVLNEKTKLYFQSPRYVFSFLESELTKGKME
jgi:hypothetical protein